MLWQRADVLARSARFRSRPGRRRIAIRVRASSSTPARVLSLATASRMPTRRRTALKPQVRSSAVGDRGLARGTSPKRSSWGWRATQEPMDIERTEPSWIACGRSTDAPSLHEHRSDCSSARRENVPPTRFSRGSTSSRRDSKQLRREQVGTSSLSPRRPDTQSSSVARTCRPQASCYSSQTARTVSRPSATRPFPAIDGHASSSSGFRSRDFSLNASEAWYIA
jgi:hypothetical protein